MSKERKKFHFQGRLIYEWEQGLEDLSMYVTPPQGVTAKMIECKIGNTKLTLGLKGTKPFIDEDFFLPVKSSESFWTFEDGVIHITLQKLSKGETWLAALKNHVQMDPLGHEEDKKRLMLERFQEEHPGFDFSDAKFSGQAPDPKTFMGGIA